MMVVQESHSTDVGGTATPLVLVCGRRTGVIVDTVTVGLPLSRERVTSGKTWKQSTADCVRFSTVSTRSQHRNRDLVQRTDGQVPPGQLQRASIADPRRLDRWGAQLARFDH